MAAVSRSAAALVVLFGTAIAWRRTPSPDVFWLLDVASRVASGQVLYRDVLEINPPLIAWLLLPFARTGHPLGWFLAGVIVLTVVAAFLAARVTRRPYIGLAVLTVLLLIPVGWFGQREHLAIALILPWLLAVLLEGDAPVYLAIAAGLGFCLKPHLMIAYLGVLAYTRRPTRGVLAPLATAAGYTLLVAWLTPDYARALHALGADYLTYQRADLAGILWANPCTWLALLGPAAWVWTRASAPDRRLGDGLAVATVGFLAAAAIQGKGWNYHYAPAVTTGVLQLLLVAGQSMRPAVLLVRCVAAGLVVGFVHLGLSRHPVAAGSERSRVDPAAYRQLVGELGDAGHPRAVLALYHHYGQAFTLTAFGGARFVSPFPMVWIFDVPGWRAKLPWWTEQIARAARRDPPDLVLLARDSVDGLDCAEILSRDASIATLLQGYQRRPDASGYKVYVR